MITFRLTLLAAVMLAVLGLSAGRFDVWNFWAWVVVMWLPGVATYSILGRISPQLVAERMKPPNDRDRATRRLVIVPFLAQLTLTGLDLRLGWSQVPLPLQIAGLVMVAAGMLLVSWVLFTNPFASSAVRIQQERGQKVISTGPYAVVRHPMYLAVVLVCLGSGPAMRSWLGGLALLPVIIIFIRRTLLEDRMLQRELDGYQRYSQHVRWRVVPFVF